MPNLTPFVVDTPSLKKIFYTIWIRCSIINALYSAAHVKCDLISSVETKLNFRLFSRRFDKVVFNLKPSNLVDSDVPSQSSCLWNKIRHM